MKCYFENGLNQDHIREMLKTLTIEEIKINTDPNDMVLLPNRTLALANSTQKHITVFNSNLDLIKTIKQIGNNNFHPLRIATGADDNIYITEYSRCEVIMTDINFKMIKHVGCKGSKDEEFNYPNGIAFFCNNVYVCDSENKRIQILSSNLDFISKIELDYQPWIIKISPNKVACISQFNAPAAVYFYNFDNFEIIHKYTDHGFGRVSEIGSYFLESCNKNSSIYFYDKNGGLLERISIERFSSFFESTADGILVYFNQQLLFSSATQKKILRFKNI